MLRSLVGSEMCIRDRSTGDFVSHMPAGKFYVPTGLVPAARKRWPARSKLHNIYPVSYSQRGPDPEDEEPAAAPPQESAGEAEDVQFGCRDPADGLDLLLRQEKVRDLASLFACTGPATNDIGPFLASDDERLSVSEKIVDTVGPEVAVQLLCSILRKQPDAQISVAEVLDEIDAYMGLLSRKQLAVAGDEDIDEPDGSFRRGLLSVDQFESDQKNEDYFRVHMMWHKKPHHTKVYNQLYVKESLD
eukprot:TRINITY_DN1998_c0_g2_i2.p1 TRINITY_DN1998_c0_g2~~TRINITY_DN1998_c0_g2_i2.p1  ORF type:complete len:275 (+),score=106.27 TRINITY_DN1998_c0_g2_i2:88-825(+)